MSDGWLGAMFVAAYVARAAIAIAGICACVWLGTNGYGGWPVVGMALLTLLLLPCPKVRLRDDKEDE